MTRSHHPQTDRQSIRWGAITLLPASLLAMFVVGCIDGPDGALSFGQRFTISGHIRDLAGRGVAGVVVSASDVIDASVTNASGEYKLEVPVDWRGAIRPSKSDLSFTPPERQLAGINADLSDNDFNATLSGHCGSSEPQILTTPTVGTPTVTTGGTSLVADAGPPLVAAVGAGATTASVVLDARGSIAPPDATYKWLDANDNLVASGKTATVQLPVGDHQLRLVLKATDGTVADDTLIVRVVAGGSSTLIVDVNHPNASDAGPGTPDQPYDSIEAAVNKARPGETVLVKSGTYRRRHPSVNRRAVITQDVHGTADRPIVVKADAGADVRLTGDYPGGDIGSTGWEIIDSSYIQISGLKFDTFTGPGLDIASTKPGAAHHITVENCIARYCSTGPNTFVAALRATGPAHYITFRKCMVSDSNSGIVLREGPVQTRQTAAVPPRAGNEAPGTPDCGYHEDMPESQWNLWPGWSEIAPRWCVIEDCLLYDNSHIPEHSDGIGTRYTIECTVRNNVAFRNADDNYDMLGATRMTFTGNIAFAADPTNLEDADGNGIKIGVRGGLDCLVAHNITFDNSRMGIDMGDTERGRVLNNTIVNNGDGHPNGFGLWFEGGRSPSGHSVLFNIIKDNGHNTSRGDYGADRQVKFLNSDANSISDGNDHNFAGPKGPKDRINDSGMFPNESIAIDTNFAPGMSIDQRLESIRSQVRQKFQLAPKSPMRGATFAVPGVTNGVIEPGKNWGGVQ